MEVTYCCKSSAAVFFHFVSNLIIFNVINTIMSLMLYCFRTVRDDKPQPIKFQESLLELGID